MIRWEPRMCRYCGTVLNDKYGDMHVASHFGDTVVHSVWVKYDPGVPALYAVEGAPNGDEARNAVLDHIGYNPGVPIVASVCTNFAPVVLPEYKIQWKPISRQRLHEIAMSSD